MRACIAIIALILAPGILFAQHAEARFVDGSIVRVQLKQPALDVQTKYGKLTVPIEDVRKIEIGLHIAADDQKRIDANVKRLASSVWKERELATKDLLQAGHVALPALRRAAMSTDEEVATRAMALVKQIAENTPAALASLKEEDLIHTAEGPIAGKLLAPTIAAKTAYFGDASLRLADLRLITVRQLGAMHYALDAAKHGSTLDQWFETGLYLDVSQTFQVTADGTVDLWPQAPGQYLAAPKGYNTVGKGGVFPAGSLIGRIGENGRSFVIGERFEGTAQEAGKLHLLIVPSPWDNASIGQYRVRIQTGNGR